MERDLFVASVQQEDALAPYQFIICQDYVFQMSRDSPRRR